MKKSTLLKFLLGLTLFVLPSVAFTSCDDDDDDWWWNDPGAGWSFQDSRLRGYWMLVQADSRDVAPLDRNYFYFNGYGEGDYYYMRNGREYDEDTRYWCQNSVSGTSRYQINIQYEYDQPLTCDYWFAEGNNTLFLQWYDSNVGRPVTYVYDRINYEPW